MSTLDFLQVVARQTHVLDDVSHRPWPPPERPWTLAQSWVDVAFLHRRVDPDDLRHLLPESVELDTFDGSAWLGVVPFVTDGSRLRGVPPLPRISSYPELHVRTYVSRDGLPGIWQLGIEAASSLAVEAGKFLYKLPYERAQMRCERVDGVLHYEAARVGAAFSARYRGSGELFSAEPGSLEEFLVERYCVYTENGGTLYRAEVQHPPWQLQRAEASIDLDTLSPMPLADVEHHALYSPRQDAVVWSLDELPVD